MVDELRGKRVTVMGLGRFGGGVGAARFLADRGARVTVTDRADAASLVDSLAQIKDLPLEALRLGGHDHRDFHDADLIVVNPAVPPGQPLLLEAKAAGIPLTTEVGLFWTRCRARVIGVTGSVGKSTTASLIETVLTASGRRAWLGGNIGGSLLSQLDEIGEEDWVVLELSSFQLEHVAALRLRPAVSVVTNFEPNHLDWHGSLDAYRNAKQMLLRWQRSDDVAVLNADDPDVATWATAARRCWFSHACSPLAVSPAMTVPVHAMNAAAATAALSAIGVEPGAIASGIAAFRGLPHRLETVGEFAGRLWVNDSKATTPAAAIAALQRFSRPIRLIAGGADKGVDLSAFADEILRRTSSAHLSGSTAPQLAGLLRSPGTIPVSIHSTFEESAQSAWQASRPGDVILLSPACASWGQFQDYRERGECFRRLAGRTGKID